MNFPAYLSRLTGVATILGAAAATARTLSPAATTTAGSEAVPLSPFEVSTDNDNGCGATETLAGACMRTNLRDVSATPNVLTPDLFQDLAVNSSDQAPLYTPSVDSVEGDNIDANQRASASRWRRRTRAFLC